MSSYIEHKQKMQLSYFIKYIFWPPIKQLGNENCIKIQVSKILHQLRPIKVWGWRGQHSQMRILDFYLTTIVLLEQDMLFRWY